MHVIRAPAFDGSVFAQARPGQDLVVYALGQPEQYARDPGLFARVNHQLFAGFLGALRALPVRRLVYICTYEVFEPVQGRIRESHALADPEVPPQVPASGLPMPPG